MTAIDKMVKYLYTERYKTPEGLNGLMPIERLLINKITAKALELQAEEQAQKPLANASFIEEIEREVYKVFTDGCGCACCKLIENELKPIINKLYKYRPETVEPLALKCMRAFVLYVDPMAVPDEIESLQDDVRKYLESLPDKGESK